jgi:hypothetical protein
MSDATGGAGGTGGEARGETVGEMISAASDRILNTLNAQESAYRSILARIAGAVRLADTGRYEDLPQVIEGLQRRHDIYERIVRDQVEQSTLQVQTAHEGIHEASTELASASMPVVVHVHVHMGTGERGEGYE